MRIVMIACIGKNRELGKNNNLIWHYKEDMRFFREFTTNNIVVMGRKTWESLPKRPLPNRKNVILTTSNIELPKGVSVYHNVFSLLNEYKNTTETLIVIGGASIYEQFLPFADELVLTEVNDTAKDADCFFPDYSDFHAIKDILKTDNFTIRVYKRNVRETEQVS